VPYRLLADSVLLVHLAFIVFVVAGGFVVLRRPKLAWLHLPAAVWGALIEFFGWICPLTPLENYFLLKGGEAGYTEGFLERYLAPVIYPDGLTPAMQILFGATVAAINGFVYFRLWKKRTPAATSAE